MPRKTSAATSQPVLRSQCLDSSTAHPTVERAGCSRRARPASRQPRALPNHCRRHHSASPHARMRSWRERRETFVKNLIAQPPPLARRVAGLALVRRRAAQSAALAPQAGQSGCHGNKGKSGTPPREKWSARLLSLEGIFKSARFFMLDGERGARKITLFLSRDT